MSLTESRPTVLILGARSADRPSGAAGMLRLYPYGGHLRLTLYLAPSICLLTGVGLERALREQLRTRMLLTHYAALETHDLGIYLNERLQQGVDRHDPRIALPGSVLARPVAGARIFLRNTTLPGASARSA